MDFMEVSTFLYDEALILLPTLWVIGALLKGTPWMPNWCIPWVLLAMGMLGAFLILGWDAKSAVQGILVAGTAVFGHQLIKQTIERNDE